jgi:hypothetical protein
MKLSTLDFLRSAMCAALFGLVAGASPAVADEAVLAVSPKVIEFYNGAYKNLKPPRAIAVAADGLHFGYSYCPEYRCYIVPSARDLAMQACVKAGGQGCRVFAVDDDIKIGYRVMDLSDLLSALGRTAVPKQAPPAPTQPCVGKTQAQCQQIAADFDVRRKQIEAKWATKIKEIRRIHCDVAYANARLCKNIVVPEEEKRDAELSALDAEMQRQLTQ